MLDPASEFGGRVHALGRCHCPGDVAGDAVKGLVQCFCWSSSPVLPTTLAPSQMPMMIAPRAAWLLIHRRDAGSSSRLMSATMT